ncbi:MAG: serine/threonine-protein kinase [Verrucomicrobia subdivision 3 bacterium]|nr:serine/threonine-protein kinase [Limisphaerales bacterium]
MNVEVRQALRCSSCGSEIEEDVPFEQCPKCLLDLGLACKEPPRASEPAGFGGPVGGAAVGLGVGVAWETERPPALLDYEILERIGRGGMGVVYRARQLSLNRVVALKVIAGGEPASPAALARFRREAEAAAKLDHPNIVAIYEVGEHEATPFLVMRFVEGVSLAEQRQDGKRRTEAEIVRLMGTVARAVHYAHSRGVLHRDLKPSNILLDAAGQPHLTDFGIAKLVGEEATLTQTAELLGTPCYMAPEQAAGKPLSRGADIYSLGVILYELLTGRRPFEAERPVEVLRKVIEEEPVAPRVVNRAVDRDLETICLKCLDKNPARRYGSALELAEDLERWERREPIVARPAGPILRLRRWVARNPAVATLIAGLLAGIAVTLGLLAQTREEKARKSIALAILRTETARQLQEIWASPSTFFGIKSETLSAMAGKEPARLRAGERRFTIALVALANPLDRILGAAPLLEHVEANMSRLSGAPTRLDLRLYKTQALAMAHLASGEVDLLQVNAKEYLLTKTQVPEVQPLVRIVIGGQGGNRAVIFTRADTGIKTLSDLRGRSFLFGAADSTVTLLAKAHLVEAGVRGRDLSRYRYVDRAEELTQGSSAKPSPEAMSGLGNPFSPMTPVEAVLDEIYDAGVVTETRFLQVSTAEKLVLLKRFEDEGALLVVQGKLSPDIVGHFRQAMIAIKDPKILQAFAGAPSAFKPCSDDDLAGLRGKLAAELLFDKGTLAEVPADGFAR